LGPWIRTVLIYRSLFLDLLLSVCLAVRAVGQGDSLSVARRIVAATSLAGKEYAAGVAPQTGMGRAVRVTAPAEVDEARQFLDQARLDVPYLPVAVQAVADAELAGLRAMIDRAAPPDSVSLRAEALVGRIAAAAGGALDPFPVRPPPLARGAAAYREQCLQCHGPAGLGDGPKAKGLKGPPPANLADRSAMSTVSPVDVYRKVTIGVAGTAMPQFDETLTPADRWAVATYIATFRANDRAVREGEGLYAVECAACHGVVGAGDGPLAASLSVRPPALRDLAVQGRFTDQELEQLILRGRPGTPMPGFARALDPDAADRIVAFLRVLPTAERQQYRASPAAATFSTVRRQLDSAVALRSDKVAFDAYLTFEEVETDVRARNAAREGFEAILIVAALMTFLAKAGATERRRHVAQGAWAAVAASAVTAVLIEALFELTPGQREAFEGVTLLLATAVLFYVSYWLLTKIEVAKWNAFVKGRMQEALQTRSGFALSSVAFLAVYREGFETILFYKALLTSGSSPGAGGSGTAAVVGGLLVGAVALALVYLGIYRFGLKVPLRPFFGISGAMLYYMAFVFAGKGVADLQEAGLVKTSVIEWAPRIPVLGIYPTLESLALQLLLIVLLIVAVVWLQRHRFAGVGQDRRRPSFP